MKMSLRLPMVSLVRLRLRKQALLHCHRLKILELIQHLGVHATEYTPCFDLKVDCKLKSFMETEVLSEAQIFPDHFWTQQPKVIHSLAPSTELC